MKFNSFDLSKKKRLQFTQELDALALQRGYPSHYEEFMAVRSDIKERDRMHAEYARVLEKYFQEV